MKGFELSSEADDHFVIRHADGDELKIAKKGLSAALMKQIQQFPCGGKVQSEGYAKGGVVKKQDAPVVINIGTPEQQIPEPPPVAPSIDPSLIGYGGQPQEIPPNEPGFLQRAGQHIGSAVGGGIRGTVGAFGDIASTVAAPVAGLGSGFVQGLTSGSNQPTAPTTPTSNEGLIPEGPRAPMSAPTAAPTGSPTPMPDMSQQGMQEFQAASQQAIGAEKEKAKIEAQGGEQIAKAYADSQRQAEATNARNLENQAKIQSKIDDVMAGIESGEINPNNYWESRSDFGKAATILGVILGGIGAGMTGKQNLALEVLDKQIERDIDAQKANLGKKKTMLDQYLKEYGTLNDAIAAQKIDKMAALEAQLKMMAAKQTSALAQSNAASAISAIRTVRAEKMMQLGLSQTKLQSEKMAQSKKLSAPGFERTGEIEQTETEASKARDTAGAIGTLNKDIDEYKALVSKHGPFEATGEAGAKMKTLSTALKLRMKELFNLGAISGADLGLMENLVGGPTDFSSVATSTKSAVASLEELKKVLNRGVEASMTSKGYTAKPGTIPKAQSTGVKVR